MPLMGVDITTSRTVLAYKTWFCLFFCLQEPIFNVLVIFFSFESRGVRSPCKEFIDSKFFIYQNSKRRAQELKIWG